MKKSLVSVLLITPGLLLVVGCGSDSNDPALVDPTDPNALSSVLVIPGAERMEGQPPQSSTDPGAPTIAGGADVEVTSGGQAVVEVTYDSSTGYEDCYVQVIGADEYFLISEPNPATQGTIQIPVNIPDNVDTGAFDFYTCIAGADGAVSNAISTSVGVTYSGGMGGGGGGNVICASQNAAAGSVFTCPNGRVLDFCIDQNSNNCYYVVGGTRANCGDCVNNQNAINNCVDDAVALCL